MLKGRENPSGCLPVSAVENLGKSALDGHHQHVPEVVLLSFAFVQRVRC